MHMIVPVASLLKLQQKPSTYHFSTAVFHNMTGHQGEDSTVSSAGRTNQVNRVAVSVRDTGVQVFHQVHSV